MCSERSLGLIQQAWIWALTAKLVSGSLFLYLYHGNKHSCPVMETINEIAAKLFCKLYCSYSPQMGFRIRKTFTLAPACGIMLGNHCILQVIWRQIFVTAANQETEASIVKCIFYGTPLFCDYVLFLFCCWSAFSLIKYDNGRSQDVLFCFKIPLHKNTKN